MIDRPSIETHEQVMFYDTDAAGVIHNIAYLRFIEKNRTLLGSELGLDYKKMEETGIYGAIVRIEIDYQKPGHLGDDLIVRGWLDEIEKVRFWCAFEITRADDGASLVTSRQQLAMVRMPEGRPSRLPSDLNRHRKK